MSRERALTQERRFPKTLFDQTRCISKLFKNIIISKRKKYIYMLGSENRGETLFWHVATFWPNNDHFDFALSEFWCTKNFTDDCFVIRINKIIYSKQDTRCLIYFSIFTTPFLRFGALKNFTVDCFVIWINNITHSKQNMGCLINLSIFTTLFPQHIFPHSFVKSGVQMVYRWNYVSASKWLMKQWLSLINTDMW